MTEKKIDKETLKKILAIQKAEITEGTMYEKLSRKVKNQANREILEKISKDERDHYLFWKLITGEEIRPSRLRIFLFYWICRLFGLTFGIKLMESGESRAQVIYKEILEKVPEAAYIVDDENRHEQALISLINEEILKYTSSIVLGLNDALVELTGALAGLTFAFRNTKIIALAGLITGIAASLSMAASEYLSRKQDYSTSIALKSALYTGAAYAFTVVFLVLPYFILTNYMMSLAVTLILALGIIFSFNFYISVAKDLNFHRRFREMVIVSMGVAILSFGIGLLVQKLTGIEI